MGPGRNLSPGTALYWRRRRYPAFAAAWALALDEGRARDAARYLDALVWRAPVDGDREGPAYATVDEALQQLRLHRSAVRGGKPQRYNHSAKPPDWETVRAGILRKIEAIERLDRWRKVRGFDA